MPRLQLDGRAVAQLDQPYRELLENILKTSDLGVVRSLTKHIGTPSRTLEPHTESHERLVVRNRATITIEVSFDMESATLVPIVKGRNT